MKKILIIQTAFMGDAILTLPLVQAAASEYKNSVIDIVSIPKTSEIFEASPFVNKTICYDKKGKHKKLKHLFGLAKKLRKTEYDIIFVPHRSARSVILAFLSRAGRTIGFDKNALPFLLSKTVHYRADKHEVYRNLSLLYGNEKISKIDWKIKPIMKFREADKDKVEKLVEKCRIENSKYAAIAPGSEWGTKRYPVSYFQELLRYLLADNYFIFIIGSAEDRRLSEELTKGAARENILVTAGDLSIPESVYLLEHCSLLITNDSAPTHMGMAADIPVLTIYCSTVPDFGFYPYNDKSTYVSYDDLECKPCGIHGHEKCPLNTFDCAYLMKPGAVNKIIEVVTNEN